MNTGQQNWCTLLAPSQCPVGSDRKCTALLPAIGAVLLQTWSVEAAAEQGTLRFIGHTSIQT